MTDSSVDRNPVEALAEEFLERFRRGERPALAEYTGRYPALADEIRELFPALVMLEDVRPASAAPSGSGARQPVSAGLKLERLGDYRILREIGRGGMGIVYEAEQESLGRHVALKVLPAHALLEPRQLERFQREARSAARLHHTNIVPVFGVGEQDGLHYYVMQFIHGQGLDQVLAVLQRLRHPTRAAATVRNPGSGAGVVPMPAANADMGSVVAVANALLTGVFAKPAAPVAPTEQRPADLTGYQPGLQMQPEESIVVEVPPDPPLSPSSSSSVRLPGQPQDATLSESGQPYWHSVARIGIQVADALAYAHTQGILHRDIKPANLLLDTQGIVWVTDFGLAKAAGSENLTHTGDVVGTLRYMAPERFRGKADARSDVYGLGLTLYELLTLEPAFDESERDKLLLQVMQRDPTRPRKLNPAVPRDLETIVLKAIARDPGHRYASAVDLAADLQRFTEDKPIQARPVSEAEKLWRWCRRNPSLAWLACLLLVSLLLGIAGVGWKWLEADAERKKAIAAEQQTGIERDRAVTARNDGQKVLAGAMLDRGIALAGQGEAGEGLLWMQQALDIASPDAPDLARVIRTNLAGWLDQTHRLQNFVAQPESLRWCTFTLDGRRLLIGGSAGVETWDAVTCQPGGRLLEERADEAMALSPDGTMLVTARRLDKDAALVQRWDVATAQALGAPLRHPGRVRVAAFTPDGKQFVTGGSDGVVRLWASATGLLVRDGFRHAPREVRHVAISPDGKTLAVATGVPGDYKEGLPAEVYLWDIATAQPTVAPLHHQGQVLTVAFAPNGTSVLTGSYDRTAQLWDARTGKALGAPLRHSHPLTVARFTSDGRTMVTGGLDGLIRWWDAATGTPLIGTLPVNHARIQDLAFSPDGKTLAVVSTTMGAVSSYIHTFASARAAARPPAQGKEALAKAAWQVGEGEQWLGRYRVAYSPDATLAVAGHLHRARMLDTVSGQPRLAAGGPDGPLWNAWPHVAVNAVSPDGRVVATSSRDVTAVGEARLWNAATGRLIGAPLPHANFVSAVAFSPDSQHVATGCFDGTVQLWDTATGRRHGAVLRQPDIVLSLAFSPDGKTLAVGHAHNHCGYYGVALWDLVQHQRALPDLKGPSHLVQFSSDGKRLLSSSWSQIQFWDPTTGQSLSPALVETAEINSATFSPDGNIVLLSTTDGTVWLRHVPSGKPAGVPMRNPFRADVAVFSPDPAARLILAGYNDGTVRLWDRATQKPLGPPLPQGRRIVAGMFTSDARACVTSSDDGNTRRWPVPTPLDDERDQLALRLEVHTGLTMGDGQTVVPLSAKQWQERHARLAGSGLPPVVGDGDVVWHDARARDAEQDDDPFAARWHLTRLIALQAETPPPAGSPAVWLAYARRARMAANHHEFHPAEADYAAAVKHGAPDQLAGWYRYQLLDCIAAKNTTAASWYAERAVALAPGDWRVYADRSEVMAQLGKADERHADLARAAEHGAENFFLISVADDYAGRGLWAKAAAVYQQARERGPCDATAWQHQALVLLKLGDRDGYQKLCRRMVDEEGGTPYPAEANNLAWTCALGPDAVADFTRPIALVEAVVRGARSDSSKYGALNTLGAILYRAGRYQEAIARLNEGIKLSGGPGSKYDWVYLAMAHHRLGETARARKYLALVVPCPPDDTFSFACLEIDVLYREALELIEGKAAAPAGTK